MMVDFPDIQPTSCSFTPPSFPITESRSQSGVRSYRIWAAKKSDGILDLGYENITQFNAGRILAAFNDAKGSIIELLLPPVIFNGITDPVLLSNFSQSGSGLSWFFVNDDPPVIERVPGGRCSTRVRLRAELRFS
jgi:hypothetical protein